MIIVIDAGHGGNDPGAVGENIQEKDVALDVAQMLSCELRYLGYTPILTRSGDYFVTLDDRAEQANTLDADVFVSIHINAAENPQANGIETYHHPNSINGKELATQVQERLISTLERRNRGVKTAKFAVLRKTSMPAILAEIGFISNPEEQELMKECQWKFKAAKALSRGITNYIRRNE